MIGTSSSDGLETYPRVSLELSYPFAYIYIYIKIFTTIKKFIKAINRPNVFVKMELKA